MGQRKDRYGPYPDAPLENTADLLKRVLYTFGAVKRRRQVFWKLG
jgi:hypothetical protein